MNFRPGTWFAVVKYIGNADRTSKWEMCSWIICQQVGLGLVSLFLSSLSWKSPTLCLPWHNQMLGSDTLALNTTSCQKQPCWIKSLFFCLLVHRENKLGLFIFSLLRKAYETCFWLAGYSRLLNLNKNQEATNGRVQIYICITKAKLSYNHVFPSLYGLV